MSVYMLDDRNVINDVNPYVAYDFSLPGTTRKTFEFSDFSERIEEKGVFLQGKNSKGVTPNKEPVSFDNIEYVIYKNTDTRVLVLGIILTMILLISMR